jgi:small subunit ribosomal protein S27Ae
VKGEALTRTHKFCPKCGPGTFLAEHENRRSCGKCGYAEVRSAADPRPPEAVKPATKPKAAKAAPPAAPKAPPPTAPKAGPPAAPKAPPAGPKAPAAA